MSKSAMTPSFNGRMAWMWAGVRPIIRLASAPTATGRPSLTLTATTEGSFSTMPSPRTYTRVLAVPRSTAMSRPMIEPREENMFPAMRLAFPVEVEVEVLRDDRLGDRTVDRLVTISGTGGAARGTAAALGAGRAGADDQRGTTG